MSVTVLIGIAFKFLTTKGDCLYTRWSHQSDTDVYLHARMNSQKTQMIRVVVGANLAGSLIGRNGLLSIASLADPRALHNHEQTAVERTREEARALLPAVTAGR